MNAIRVDVNFSTGERAGNVPTNNRSLPCPPGWQYIPQHDDPTSTALGWEIRIVADNVIAPYLNKPGVTLLQGVGAIEGALAPLRAAAAAEKFAVNEQLLAQDLADNNISLRGLDAASPTFAQSLYDAGARVAVRKYTGHVDTIEQAAARFQLPG